MGGFDYWKLLAGLGIFLFAMQLLENSIKDLGGRTFRKIIRQYTNTRIKAILNGAAVTALLQSSSAVSLMVLAFVGAGIMNMENAIGVILGSNIGTTLTAWIVATLGFKIKIETFALPFIGAGGIGLIFLKPTSHLYHVNRLLIGFGFLFLGLDYMKTSVEAFSQHFDPQRLQNMAPWMYLVIGTLMTAVMQASAATIAVALTALNSGLMGFDMAAAMVIGANIGTTITVLLGAIGSSPPKKRVAASHLVFNMVTGIVAFSTLPILVAAVELFVDISTNGPVGLALLHTLFNVTGVLIFLPFVSMLTALLIKVYPEHREILSVHLANTPTEEVDAAGMAMKNEIRHLLQECQLYTLRILYIDEKLVFDEPLPFEKNRKKKLTIEELYTHIKLLHADIISFYSGIQKNKLDVDVTQELERAIVASRNILNAAKNFKSIRTNLDEFKFSDTQYLNIQYERFRKRLLFLYHEIENLVTKNPDTQYEALMHAFQQIELADNQFIDKTVKAAPDDSFQQIDLSTLFLVNRLFTQACRMIIFSLKDLSLSQEKTEIFDKTI